MSNSARLEAIFADCFAESHQTELLGGADEPLYRPAVDAGGMHRIYYRADYFSSALHEVAHWCIAGPERRQQVDYGYWYQPDGRSVRQQSEFEQVEVKPQALEWHFSLACGHQFRVSADNLTGQAGDEQLFLQRVQALAVELCETGLGARARLFRDALADAFDRPPIEASLFRAAQPSTRGGC